MQTVQSHVCGVFMYQTFGMPPFVCFVNKGRDCYYIYAFIYTVHIYIYAVHIAITLYIIKVGGIEQSCL